MFGVASSLLGLLVAGSMLTAPFGARAAHRTSGTALKRIFALLLPVIIIGGIYSGYFSPTESAAVALAYALFIEFFADSSITVEDAQAQFASIIATAN